MMREMKSRGKRIFLTGATGSMGLAAVRELVAAGHIVLGTTRSRLGGEALSSIGATPVEVDLFDARELREAMTGVDVVAHFATSIPRGLAAVKLDAWHVNDRLRREATSFLLDAARANGIRRFIFESISLAYPDRGETWIDESERLEDVSPVMRTAIEAEALLERFRAAGGEAVSLRFGRLYGPGRASEDFVAGVRKRQMPIVGRGDNYVSSIHVADVGTAVAAALDVAPGVYNVVDDEPCSQRALVRTAAAALDAPAPRRAPEWLVRLMMGHVVPVLTVSQRVSNRRFREATGWKPLYPSVALGWPHVASVIGGEVASIAS